MEMNVWFIFRRRIWAGYSHFFCWRSQYTPKGVKGGIRYCVIFFYQQCTPSGVKNAIGFIPEITMHP
jgi:hypothetical protein